MNMEILTREFTVAEFIDFIKEQDLKTKIIVVEDACYTFDGVEHNAEQFHQDAINQMKDILK